MKKFITLLIAISAIFLLVTGCGSDRPAAEEEVVSDDPPHIVFVTGDEEYRSEETMPMLALMIPLILYL